MGIPDHLTCLLRNLYAGQEATVRTLYGTTDWLKIEKGVQQGCLLSPVCLTYTLSTTSSLDELQAGIKIGGRNINNFRYVDDTTLMAESKEELKSLLMRVKEESDRAGLKLNIKKSMIMALGPITSWQIGVKKVDISWQISSFSALKSLWMVTAAIKSEESFFLAGRLWQTYTVFWKAETLLYQQRSV